MPPPSPTATSARPAHRPRTRRPGPQGQELTVEFTVCGRDFLGINGGPMFIPNEAVSFMILTDDQAETDRLWNAIVGNGGQESMCGWCKDRWGFSWQITPRGLLAATRPGSRRRQRAMNAMITMRKIDIASIEARAHRRAGRCVDQAAGAGRADRGLDRGVQARRVVAQLFRCDRGRDDGHA